MTPRPVARGASDPEAGFTLLEVLIAMTLLGMLTVMLAAGLRTGTRVWQRGESLSAGMEDVRLTQEFLRRSLGAAYPLFLTADRLRPAIDFDGRRHGVTFLGPAPVALAAGGRARIAVEAVAQGDHVNLAVTARPELSRGPADGGPPAETVLSRLVDVTFSYYGDAAQQGAPGWHDRWVERTALPQLIKVQVLFPAGDPRRWPDLVVRPMIFADVACGYDPLTKTCRGR